MSADTLERLEVYTQVAMGEEVLIPVELVRQAMRDLAEARASRKRDCVAFFRWWWNQPGNDTEAGYDQWEAEHND